MLLEKGWAPMHRSACSALQASSQSSLFAASALRPAFDLLPRGGGGGLRRGGGGDLRRGGGGDLRRGGGGGDLRLGVAFVSLGVAAGEGDVTPGIGWLGQVMRMHSINARTRVLSTTADTSLPVAFFSCGLYSLVALSEQKLSLRRNLGFVCVCLLMGGAAAEGARQQRRASKA